MPGFNSILRAFASLGHDLARRDQSIQARENEIKNLEALLEDKTDMKKTAEAKNTKIGKELENLRALFSDLQVSIDRLPQQVSTLQTQVTREEKLKAAFKEFKQYEDDRAEKHCVEIDARLDALSIEFDEELYHICSQRSAEAEHGKANLDLEGIEAYDPEAETKYAVALHALRDLKVDSVHHARSDGVPVSVPTIAPQGLVILLADPTTKMETFENGASPRFSRSSSSLCTTSSAAVRYVGIPISTGKVKFLIVTMDYFMKWIEAKSVAIITGSQVNKFMWDNIVCRFGLPGEIVSDNDKQFSDNPFKDWCDKLNIKQRFASVKHPQSNGLVERVNRSLGEGIKARLGEGNKNWAEELPHVLWAHRTMIKSSHGNTPFSLTYGTEAVIPVEIGMPTYRTAALDVVHNDEELRLNLDLLEKQRERASISEAKAKLKMTKYYNARVRDVTFRPGDFVYRINDASHAVDGGKLGPKWEGPYEVTGALGYGAYKLWSMDEIVLPRTWNITNLKRCYL
nr:reverse transcriptase domain-containing protein [Tanacetum cinerariifolium]